MNISWRSRTGSLPVLVLFLLYSLGSVHSIGAQFPTRTTLRWRTIDTRSFSFHYPVELEAWTRRAAARADAIDSLVSALVGFRVPHRTNVIVDDPFERPNGSAWPYLNGPVINLWASPPTPRDDIGDFPTWGEMLVSHEFGHIVHLTRPSRNAFTRRFWAAMPVDLGPIALNAPRWVIEGYATFIEGRVTGSGRPHSAWRAAFLRQWALEGQLPRYENLDAWGAYEGGSFAYLAGSAFIEWLVEKHGDSSFVNVWRRLSARQTRTFDEAFAGVFGESPAALYGKFTVDVTRRSIEVAHNRASAADTGEIVQRLARTTGDPAISRDGQRVAIVLRSATAPSRVVIWKTAPQPDTGKRRRDSLLLARDPEDVPARSIYPPPKTPLFTIRAPGGASYESPRFLSDGRVLLSRSTARGDETYRDDLYLWNPERHSVRRITHGASVRGADPSPNGQVAVASRCRGGWCSLVTVHLPDGEVTTIIAGSDSASFYHPRFSPDGRTVLVSVHHRGTWRLATVDLTSRELTLIDPDDGVNRYDGEWTGQSDIVAVSDRGGIANIVAMNVANRSSRTLTSVTGAAVAPVRNPSDGSIWFLSLYSRGYDLRRILGNTQSVVIGPADAGRLTPALPLVATDTPQVRTGPVSESRRFGLAPRFFRWIPQPTFDGDGASAALSLVSRDIIGRSDITVAGAFGEPATWRGGTLAFRWAGSRPTMRFEGFAATQDAGRHDPIDYSIRVLESSLAGGEFGVDERRQYDTWAYRLRAGVSGSQLHVRRELFDSAQRSTFRGLFTGDASVAAAQRIGTAGSITESLSGSFGLGRTFDRGFGRGLVTAGIAPSLMPFAPMSFSASYGRTSTNAPLFEQFSIGGGPSVLLDRSMLGQRIAAPVLPTGTSVGTSVFTYRAALGAPLSIYWWGGSTSMSTDRFTNWNRVVGVELTASVSAIAPAGTPPARGQIGIGESLDAPMRRHIRAYISLVLNP